MSYSYTEKKRIRKNFGTFAKVMDLPNLIETQTKSYAEFLQADVTPEARKKTRAGRSIPVFISYTKRFRKCCLGICFL